MMGEENASKLRDWLGGLIREERQKVEDRRVR